MTTVQKSRAAGGRAAVAILLRLISLVDSPSGASAKIHVHVQAQQVLDPVVAVGAAAGLLSLMVRIMTSRGRPGPCRASPGR
jgi:hypothetical protein